MPYLDETTPDELKLAKRRDSLPLGLSHWWQLAAGALLGLGSPLAYYLLSYGGVTAIRLIFPFVLLSASSQLGFSYSVTRDLPGFMIHAQFPIEGVIAWLVMRRGSGALSAILLILLLHVLGATTLWLMAYTSQVAH